MAVEVKMEIHSRGRFDPRRSVRVIEARRVIEVRRVIEMCYFIRLHASEIAAV